MKLTETQAQVLGAIDMNRDSMSVADVAGSLRMANSTARSALTALERLGLVAASYSGNRTLHRHYDMTVKGSTALEQHYGEQP